VEIQLTRSGGFANLRVSATVETQELGEDLRERLLDFLSQNHKEVSEAMPDAGRTELRWVGEDQVPRTVVVDDTSASPSDLDLVDELLEIAGDTSSVDR
jgi:hypothetical protein